MVKVIKINDALHDFLLDVKRKHGYKSVGEYLEYLIKNKHSTYRHYLARRDKILETIEKR